MKRKQTFSKYQKFLIAILTVVQFTVVLDFAVLVPLGTYLMDDLKINAGSFGVLVSSYAIAAGVSGFAMAGFSDRFDRRKILLWVYFGFIIGTVLCAIAWNYESLLLARSFAGIFGGVMSGISFAVITDVFKFEVRGRVMGFIQMAFAGSQILGIPLGLYFAELSSWHISFYFIAAISIINFVLLYKYMQPLTVHLENRKHINFIATSLKIFKNKNYLLAFSATFFLATGGYMLMPYSSPFLVHNVGIAESDLMLIFFMAGLGTLVFSPVFGRLSDSIGKFKLFVIGSLLAIPFILIYTSLDKSSLQYVLFIFTAMTVVISSRMITSSAILTAIPSLQERGAFMNINSSVQQLSGGMAALISAGLLHENTDKSFSNFHILGYVTVVSLLLCVVLFYFIQRSLNR
ncbi:MAG: MFS transporter [Chitinophagaceae bacterium]|nr:MFS transporter [Chitinophagaceae bacterium]